MSESAKVQKISQILLKPVALLVSADTAELSDAYIASLMETLLPQSEAANTEQTDLKESKLEEYGVRAEAEVGLSEDEGRAPVRLEYVRPMSGGVHVLRLDPPLELEQIQQLTERLSAREDVEYAEPDQPRRR